MARWLSFFAEYNLTAAYKPGKQNVLADALSRRPDYELAHVVHLESTLFELIRGAYYQDPDFRGVIEALGTSSNIVKLTKRQQAHLHRYSLSDGLLLYSVNPGDEKRVVVPNDEDLRHRILYEAHDTPGSGHWGARKRIRLWHVN